MLPVNFGEPSKDEFPTLPVSPPPAASPVAAVAVAAAVTLVVVVVVVVTVAATAAVLGDVDFVGGVIVGEDF